MTTEIRVRTALTDEQLEPMVGKILTPNEIDLLVSGPTRVLKPDGKLLLEYLPGALAGETLEQSYGTLHELRKFQTDNRGNASGTERHKSFEGATRTRSKPVPSAIIGSFDPGGAYRYCRLTAWSGKEWEKYRGLFPLFQDISKKFAEHVPDRWLAQYERVKGTHPDWIIPGTAFTTITVNNTYPTGVHTDKGDLDEGFSTLSTIRRGDYAGGWLCFPQFRVGVDMQHGDLLLMDAHEWHGNTALELRDPECDWGPEKAVWWVEAKRPDTGKVITKPICNDHLNGIKSANVMIQRHWPVVPAERISVVSYFRTKMTTCGSMDDEVQRARDWAEKRASGGEAPQVGQAVVEEMATEAVGGNSG